MKHKIKFIEMDWVILNELRKNSRMAFSDIAKMCNTSSTYIYNRVQYLSEEGVLLGYTAVIDNSVFGIHYYAFGFVTKDPDVSDQFLKRQLDTIEELCELYTELTGFKYIIKVAIKDIDHLNVVRKKILTLAGVKQLELSLTAERMINRIPIVD
jgi:Lrp/AsnC family leucine-responsive transcriptional regulator